MNLTQGTCKTPKHFAHIRGDQLEFTPALASLLFCHRRAEQMASHDGDELEAVSAALRAALRAALSTKKGACVHKLVYRVPARLATRAAAASFLPSPSCQLPASMGIIRKCVSNCRKYERCCA